MQTTEKQNRFYKVKATLPANSQKIIFMNSVNCNGSRNSKNFKFQIICISTFLIFGIGILQSQSPPPGELGGNKPPCECTWGLTLEGKEKKLEDCGPKCGHVVDIKDEEGSREYVKSVPFHECASGFKNFKQKTLKNGKRRYTLQKGTITYKGKHYPPESNPNADCSGCPPGVGQIVNLNCGDEKEECKPQAGDITVKDTTDPPENMGCVPIGA